MNSSNMDSCHIFNFIFGTKKATTELSRCFSNIGENVSHAAARKKSSNNHNHQRDSSTSGRREDHQPPKSPLKQLQNRLVNIVSKVQKTHNNEEEAPSQDTLKPTTATLDSKAKLVCVQSGTYKATLVRSLSDDSEEEKAVELDNGQTGHCFVNIIHGEQSNIEIFANPLQQDDYEVCQEEKQAAATQSEEDKQATSNIEPENEVKYDKNNNSNNNNNDDKQATFRAERIVFFEDCSNQDSSTKKTPDKNDKRSLYVRNLVRSIESGSPSNLDKSRRSFEEVHHEDDSIKPARQSTQNVFVKNSFASKPMTLVKPLPPKAPPKSFRARCIRHQLSLNKPTKLQQLFHDERFLARFFDALEPLERCAAAQVCRKWRDILYSDHKYWKGLMNVIDCTQLRREHLVECIVNTLQSAKMKQQFKSHDIASSNTPAKLVRKSTSQQSGGVASACFESPPGNQAESEIINDDTNTGGDSVKKPALASDTIFGFDHEDVWRIQEICNRFALQKHNHPLYKPQSDTCNGGGGLQTNSDQHQQHPQMSVASKSSSIPSQISSTFSSASLSSILSPLSESSRIETMKEKLYTSIDSRGFNAICLFGATDDDIEDLVCKIPSSSHERITIGRLNNCSITNRGLDRFITSFQLINELELTGCNELTNTFDLSPLTELECLIITDCINIADGLAQKLIQILGRLRDLTIQAYHLTDAFIEFLGINCDTSKLQRIELLNCKEITNQGVIVLAKHFSQLECLSISGSTKVSNLILISLISARMFFC